MMRFSIRCGLSFNFSRGSVWKRAVFETDTLPKVRLAHLDKLETKVGILETENGVLKKDRTALLCENADLKRENEHLRQQLREAQVENLICSDSELKYLQQGFH